MREGGCGEVRKGGEEVGMSRWGELVDEEVGGQVDEEARK